MARATPPRTGDGDAFRFRAGRACLDLTSTLLWRRLTPVEQLRAPDDLARWLEAAGAQPRPTAVTEEDVARARELREAIYRVALARIAGRPLPRADVATVNAAAAGPAPVPQIGPAGARRGRGDGSVASHLAAIAREFVELVTGPLAGRIRQCRGEDCAFLFVDTSRPGTRRWCAMSRCGNRHHVREFRARHAPGSAASAG